MQDRLTDVRWRRHGLEAAELRALTEAVSSIGAGGVDLKREGRSRVRRITLARVGEITVKVTPIRGLLGRARERAGLARADRHWEGAAWLTAAGIPTPRPLALGTARDAEGPVSVLALAYVPGRTALELLARGQADPRALREVGAALGDLVARITAAGRFNRDHKPSNLLITDARPPAAAVLDCVGLRAASGRDVWRGADRMLASMLIEPMGCSLRVPPALRVAVIRGYLARVWAGEETGAGASPEQQHGVDRRAWMRASRARLWDRVEALVERHGDPRPAVDPLGT